MSADAGEKMSAQEAIERAFARHTSVVGEVAYYWNLLHERLGVLFSIAAAINNQVGMAVWYSVQSDRGQRGMLLAALRANKEDVWEIRPKAKAEIKWLTDYVSGTLAERRNDALHAPCELGVGIFEDRDGNLSQAIEVGPAYFLGNPRASKLSQKNLHKEFTWYAETARALALYADAMVTALTVIEATWPERPRLPSLRQSHSRKA
ncbi:hypothetical protein [Caulobacter sp. DWP3-1-3b2]|uniref:hypothetical protein n=1 Tax=Caulobacter sp. DWP3-1-3b2 TaxID=2804643 RepID=UPI003CF250D5